MTSILDLPDNAVYSALAVAGMVFLGSLTMFAKSAFDAFSRWLFSRKDAAGSVELRRRGDIEMASLNENLSRQRDILIEIRTMITESRVPRKDKNDS